MAALFDCTTDNIGLHLKNIFTNGELDEISVIEDFSVTANDRKNYKTKHYNLDAIISVGYRVNSAKATQFRIWATKVLKEFIMKGFVLDMEEFAASINEFLTFRKFKILTGKGKISKEKAEKKKSRTFLGDSLKN